MDTDPPALLAIDLGLRTGLASFAGDGRLRWYRSQNFGTVGRLKRGVLEIVRGHRLVVAEGDRNLGRIWERAAFRVGASFRLTSAEEWRPTLLLPRERRTGRLAKTHADPLARRIIAWSGLTRPTALRHDAAEAIAMGMWAALESALVDELPDELLA